MGWQLQWNSIVHPKCMNSIRLNEEKSIVIPFAPYDANIKTESSHSSEHCRCVIYSICNLSLWQHFMDRISFSKAFFVWFVGGGKQNRIVLQWKWCWEFYRAFSIDCKIDDVILRWNFMTEITLDLDEDDSNELTSVKIWWLWLEWKLLCVLVRQPHRSMADRCESLQQSICWLTSSSASLEEMQLIPFSHPRNWPSSFKPNAQFPFAKHLISSNPLNYFNFDEFKICYFR